MNELTTMDDAELDHAIEELKERELALKTESGQSYVTSKMREIIAYLESIGYKTEADEMALAKLWAHGLQEEFVRLGVDGMKEAIVKWAENDASEYRSFPKIPWLKEACHEVTGDPRVEKGRRVQAEAERKMKEDHEREFEQWKKDHLEEWERVKKSAEEVRKRCQEHPELLDGFGGMQG